MICNRYQAKQQVSIAVWPKKVNQQTLICDFQRPVYNECIEVI